MDNRLTIGQSHEEEMIVTSDVTAMAYGNPGVEVLATPAMIGLIEKTAHRCIPLREGEGTVGTKVNIEHLAATPVGMKVIARVEVIEIEGRRVLFRVEAHDEQDQIARGTHERFIVGSMAKFLERAMAKGSKGR